MKMATNLGTIWAIGRMVLPLGALVFLLGPAGSAPPRIPPFPGVIIEEQPSGEKIIVRLSGTQKSSWYTDENGFTVTKRPDGSWVYAIRDETGKLAATDLQAGAINPMIAGLIKGLNPLVDGAEAVKASKPSEKCEFRILDAEKQLFEIDGFTVIPTERGLAYAIPNMYGDLVSSGSLVGVMDPHKIGIRPGIRGFKPGEHSVVDGGPKKDKDAAEQEEGLNKKWWESTPKTKGVDPSTKDGSKALNSILSSAKDEVFARESRSEDSPKRLPAQRFKTIDE